MSKKHKENRNRKKNSGINGGNRAGLILMIGALVILLAAGAVLGIVLGKKNRENNTENTGTETETSEIILSEEVPEAEEAYVNAPLELNLYPEVNTLISQYYEAAADGDTDMILQLRDQCGQTELLQIREKSRYLEGYEDIDCYTKPGPEEDSFVVYVRYYAKFFNIPQRVCGLNTYIVCRNEQGNYYIHDLESDEAMKEYRTKVTGQDDVVELFNQVQVEYNEIVSGDGELAAFLEELSGKLKAAVGDALAEAEAQAEAETQEGSEDVQAAEPVSMIVTANDVVNIRKSDSQNSESLGKASIGQEFKLLENKANGWSCVEYNNGVAFIKSEFLDGEAMAPGAILNVEGQSSGGQNEDDVDNSASAAGENSESASDNSGVPASGEFRLSDSVNVRKEPSQNADRIGVAYSGTTIEILEKQDNGWTKVKFNGTVGYIKTEVLK